MRPRHQSGRIREQGTKRRYWYGTYRVYMKDERGKETRKETGVHLGYKSEMTKSAARAKLQKIIFEATGKGVSATDKVTLAWFWEERFLVAGKSRWSPATLHGYKSDWKHYIAPALGDLKLSEIESFTMQRHFNKLAAEGYSRPVVQKSKTLLSSVLSHAADLRFLPANPMIGASGRHIVKMPKIKKRPKPTVADDEMEQLCILIPGQRDRLMLILAFHYGLSAEELFGLTWDCVDKQYIHIRHVAWRGRLYRDTTKREARMRDLKIHPDLKAMIADWQAASGGQGDALLFPGKDGESPMWPNVWLQKRIMPTARTVGIQNITFEIMRRTFSTEELARDPKSVQYIMGHEKPDMTAKIYAQSQQGNVAKLLDERWERLGLGATKSVQ